MPNEFVALQPNQVTVGHGAAQAAMLDGCLQAVFQRIDKEFFAGVVQETAVEAAVKVAVLKLAGVN